MLVVGEAGDLFRLDIEHEQVGDAPRLSREHDRTAVRRPGGVGDGPDVGTLDLDALLHVRVVDVHDDELVVSVGDRHEGEQLPVRRPGTRGVEKAKRVHVRVRSGAGQSADDSPGARIGHEQVDREEVPLRDEGHVAAVGADRGRHVLAARPRGRSEQQGAHLARCQAPGHQRPVLALDRPVPVRRHGVLRLSQHAHDGVLPPHLERAAVQLGYGLIAIGAADVGPERLAEAVREEASFPGHLFEGRHVVAQQGIPQPHARKGVFAADREVFGHPLHHPQRQLGHAAQPASAPRLGDVVLEGVHQLVAEHVVGVVIGARQRHDDAILQRLGHTAGALADEAREGVGLLEIGMVGVQDDRLGPLELVLEGASQPLVPALGHAGGVLDGDCSLVVVVDVEVGGLHDPEIEGVVLHLVPPEVLSFDRCGQEQDRQCGDGRQDSGAQAPADGGRGGGCHGLTLAYVVAQPDADWRRGRAWRAMASVHGARG